MFPFPGQAAARPFLFRYSSDTKVALSPKNLRADVLKTQETRKAAHHSIVACCVYLRGPLIISQKKMLWFSKVRGSPCVPRRSSWQILLRIIAPPKATHDVRLATCGALRAPHVARVSWVAFRGARMFGKCYHDYPLSTHGDPRTFEDHNTFCWLVIEGPRKYTQHATIL